MTNRLSVWSWAKWMAMVESTRPAAVKIQNGRTSFFQWLLPRLPQTQARFM